MVAWRSISVAAVVQTAATYANAASVDDAYIAGYAAGVLKHDYHREMPSLTVRDGIVSVPVRDLTASEQAKVFQTLTEIPGVTAVRASEDDIRQRTPESSGPIQISGEETVSESQSIMLPTGLLPVGHLFKPLLADPRWAHFSAAYRNYQSNNFDGKNIASVSFGETIPFYRGNFGESMVQWEAGVQAGVFSDFNLDASSSDLVNTDFIASAYSSVRADQFSAFGRLFHQSSHLGDEFLLRKLQSKFQRVNLSYEGADLKLSYELPFGFRLYGGGIGLFHREPAALKPWSTQYGVEFRSPWRIDLASMRPIAAVDIKNFEENKWNTDISARAGLEFDNLQVLGRKLQLFVEYFNGYTPSGQFYKEKVEYVGLGAHYHF